MKMSKINKGRLPSPCVVKVKKLCRRLPHPPTQSVPKRGGAKRHLPTPNGSHNLSRDHCTPRTKRRIGRNKPRPQHETLEAASDPIDQRGHGLCLQAKTSSVSDPCEIPAGGLGDENHGETYLELSDNDGERDLDGFLEVESDSDMDTRRRRRLLERVARVYSEDTGLTSTSAPTSWRSKVYNDEVAVRPEKTENDLRRKSQDLSRRSSRDSCDGNNVHDPNVQSESRESDEATSADFLRRRSSRRMSEESNCSEKLSERLARRRAQRLEEAGDSSSLDSSFDSPRLQRDSVNGQRRWSRLGNERCEEGAQENGYRNIMEDVELPGRGRDDHSNVTTPYGPHVPPATAAWGDPRQRSGDSVMSIDSNDPAEGDEEDDGESEQIRSLRRRRKIRRRQSEESANGGSKDRGRGEDMVNDMGESRRRSRHAMRWGEADSSFPSTESNASFWSCDEGSASGQWTSKDSRTFSQDAPQETSTEQATKIKYTVNNTCNDNNINNNNKNNNQNGKILSESSSYGDIYSLAPTGSKPEDNNNARRKEDSRNDEITQRVSQQSSLFSDANGKGQRVSSIDTNDNQKAISSVNNGNLDSHHPCRQGSDQNCISKMQQNRAKTEDNGLTHIPANSSVTSAVDLLSNSPKENEAVSAAK
ncbi:hypothetical protein ElyMa_005016600, partial [Elysia marginata]